MIHIRRNYDTLEVEIELRGIPAIPNEMLYIGFELLMNNNSLHAAYYDFRALGRTVRERGVDVIRMPITPPNQAALANLQSLTRYAMGRGAESISKGSVLA